MKAATALIFVLLALTAATFFVWAAGRAFDYEHGCAKASGQCETP